MRKFQARWWAGSDLTQWRYMVACGDYELPFFAFPRVKYPNQPGWMRYRSCLRDEYFRGGFPKDSLDRAIFELECCRVYMGRAWGESGCEFGSKIFQDAMREFDSALKTYNDLARGIRPLTPTV